MAGPGPPVNRNQLADILPKACEIAEDPEALVIGSQAILGAHDDEPPEEASRSIEVDLDAPACCGVVPSRPQTS